MRMITYLVLFFFALPLFSEERKHGGKAIEVKVEAEERVDALRV